MCLLIVLTGADAEFPIVVAANRDEQRNRKSSPPGLFAGERRRILSPRDRAAGGTWLAVNERGLFAGITNVSKAPREDHGTTRGTLPHLALDADDLEGARAAVEKELAARRYNAFQLVLADAERALVIRQVGGELDVAKSKSPVVVSNEHRPGELDLPALAAATAPGVALPDLLSQLTAILQDDGSGGGHRILKKGGDYGTVSSSVIAVPRRDLRGLIWKYATGDRDLSEFQDYGNLGRRLVEG
jgi:uncharacterized protein with NRDE domain